jgi:CRISPR-associated endonuclease/helicase Cas3
MPKDPIEFDVVFKSLTGNSPLSWQRRLYGQWIEDDIRSIIDLPTGLGKTMVIPIWLIAQATNRRLGRRLIYVVDRRTVVDQATFLAEQLAARPCIRFIHEWLGGPPSVSTLRGQLADNREWSRDPSRPAIIIGTVDLIGSALLFSGYRSSFKERPLQAGLLGQDSLLALDEAHLSKPFEKLIGSIDDGKNSFQAGQGQPMRVIRMSATSAGSDGDRFKLEPSDRVGDRESNVIVRRFEAEKRLTIESPVDKSELNGSLCRAAIELASRNARVVVFVRSPDDASRIGAAIQRHLVESVDETGKKQKKPKFAIAVAVLTGTMRGLERDELVTPPESAGQHERRVMQRFLKPANEPELGPAILVSTSAGEVGFDLNADHLVCDAAPLDSMIQRLGRVNRRGDGKGDTAAIIRVFPETPKADKAGKPLPPSPFEAAARLTVALLQSKAVNGKLDASPKAIAALKTDFTPAQLNLLVLAVGDVDFQRAKDELIRKLVKAASSPEPSTVGLTDILLDAWGMTSIFEPMAGRPEVAPWLRGIADEPPETTIAWRAELDIEGFDELEPEDVEEWFTAHRIQTYETLSVPTSVAARRLSDRWENLSDTERAEVGGRFIVVDRAGLKLIMVRDVIAQISEKNTDVIQNADLILPAGFGGIERHKGLLDESAPEVPKDGGQNPLDEQHKPTAALAIAPDVADERGRYRELVVTTEEGETKEPVGSGKKPDNIASFARFALDLESDDEKRVQLVSYVPKRDNPEWRSQEQTLAEHVRSVRKQLDGILARLDVPETVKCAAQLAADFHDHGKNREFFQHAVGGVPTPNGPPWSDRTLGKSGGKRLRKAPRGYRHEFGSLREFLDEHKNMKFTDAEDKDITEKVIDLAAHLIATHHGRARPHFRGGGFDPDDESRSPEIHTDSIRRFARLQREYGHWRLAWLENLLRCADALGSAENDADSEEAKP